MAVIVLVLLGLAIVYGALWFAFKKVTQAIAEQGLHKSKLTFVQDHFGFLVLLYTIVLVVALPTLFYIVYEDRLLEGIVASIGLVWFFRTQLPTLISPMMCPVFHHWNDSTGTYEDSAMRMDTVATGTETFLILRMINAGLTTYEACGCSITLPKEFEIIPRDPASSTSTYPRNDYDKPFNLQRQNNCARFAPDPTHVLHPGDSVWYPILIRSPLEEGRFQAQIEFSSKSSWSSFKRRMSVAVERPND